MTDIDAATRAFATAREIRDALIRKAAFGLTVTAGELHGAEIAVRKAEWQAMSAKFQTSNRS